MKKLLLSFVASACAFSMSAQTNLLENGGFESWDGTKAVAWTSVASTATVSQSNDAHSGSYSALVKHASSNRRLSHEEISLKAGTYTLKFWVKSATTSVAAARPGYVFVTNENQIADPNNDYKYGDYTNGIADWQEIKHEFTLEEAARIALIVMNPKSNSSDFLIDDVTLTTTDGGIDESNVGPEPEPFAPEGAGTLVSPYTISDVKGLLVAENCPTEKVWVKGTIVGCVDSGSKLAEEYTASNLALGTSETEWVPVQLPGNSNIRKALNLVDTPDNLGKEVWILGEISTYFSVAGLKNTTEWSWDGSDVCTAISSAAIAKDAVIFDLSGRRVNRAENGIFIVNGKKVIR